MTVSNEPEVMTLPPQPIDLRKQKTSWLIRQLHTYTNDENGRMDLKASFAYHDLVCEVLDERFKGLDNADSYDMAEYRKDQRT